MEYKLLKTIESNQANLLIPKQTMPRLTAYPLNNCVNPGLGQIARLYSFYVPLYSNPNLHSISKSEPNVEALHQEGKGSDLEQESQPMSQISENDDNLNPIDYNEKKRKLMGAAIQDSFLHPKIIKTDKIVFVKDKKQSNSTPISLSSGESVPKKIKHKFQFE
jgi:hypothetical protein